MNVKPPEPKIVEQLPLVEQVLGEHAGAMRDQFLPYKSHVYRVIHFCFAFHPCDEIDAEKIIIAGCFHDLGIWPDDTVDYLEPSIRLAREYLRERGKDEWSDEIAAMIDLHHKYRSVTDCPYPLVEVFRKGDWVDASLGWRSFGLPRAYVRRVQATFPNLGFHRNLVRLTIKQLRRHPFNPLPMMKW